MMTHLTCEVLIIGAGLAGLAAGYDLALSGYNVKIVESKDRVGGRVSTTHFLDGSHCEEGAFSFGNGEQPLWEYIQKFNLPIVEHTSIKRKFCFKNYSGTTDQKAFFLKGKEQEIVLYELFNYFRPQLEEIDQDMPFTQALELVGASLEAIEWLQTMTLVGLLGKGFEKLSTKAVLAFIRQYDNSTSFYALQGGNDQLPQAFAHQLKDNILFHHAVNKVEQLDDSCVVTGGTFTIHAQRVILAIPLPDLNKIEIYPTLSSKKKEAIKKVFYTPCARLSMMFPAHVDRNRPEGGVFLFSDELGWIRDQSVFQSNVGKKIVINASVAGHLAEKLSLSVNQWQSSLSDLISQKYYDWNKDETDYHCTFLSEGYCWFSVTAYQEQKYLRQPEGKLYFAGEHTCHNYASMNGAIQSGIRAAQEVSASLR